VISFITYIIAGFSQSAWISLPCGIAMLLLVLLMTRFVMKFGSKENAE
jgi:hypothetical protein